MGDTIIMASQDNRPASEETTTTAGPKPNPFKGPISYEEGDKFYGREDDLKYLTNIIRNEPLTLLFARSGTGKTSLIKAGLVPKMKEFNFLPVYIHLDKEGVEKSSASDLCDYVIRLCEQQLHDYITEFGEDRVSIIRTKRTVENSLFEYIHSLNVTMSRDKNEDDLEDLTDDAHIIKPLLIFDQFEEILTQPFNKTDLHFILNELKCLLENQIPEYLDKSFSGYSDKRYLRLKDILLRKQKSFRVIFSFREEYLPWFESLRREIPAIRFTNSRYRLEPFTPKIAEQIIIKTDPDIPPAHAAAVVNQLEVNVSSNFEKVIVEPFLLSLVCYKIYFKLCDQRDNPDEIVMLTEIKRLVNEAIETYVDEIYATINEQTKDFIERRLVTSDHKRTTFNYDEAINNFAPKTDIDKLIDNPEYRLLNKEDFLDSVHIEILHDRLLPPIARRREDRIKRLEDEALKEKQRQLEDENRIKTADLRIQQLRLEKDEADFRNKKLQQRVFRSALYIGIVSFSCICIFLYEQNTKARTLAAKLQNTVETQQIQSKNLADDKIILKAKNDSLSIAQNKNDTLYGQLNQKIGELSIQNRKLKNQEVVLKAAKITAIDAKNQSDSLNHQLVRKEAEMKGEITKKDSLAAFFKKQSNSLLAGLQKTNPFEALAVGVSDYEGVTKAGIQDSSILRDFDTTLLNMYLRTPMFSASPLLLQTYDYGAYHNGWLITHKTAAQMFYFYNLYDPQLRIDSLSDSSKSPEIRNSIETYGFMPRGDFLYYIRRSGNKDSLFAWRVTNYAREPQPSIKYAISDFDIAKANSFSYDGNRFFFGDHLIYCWREKNKYNIWYFDFQTGHGKTTSLTIKNVNEKIYDVNRDASIVVTRSSLLLKPTFTVYNNKEGKTSSPLVPQSGGKEADRVSVYGDSVVASFADSAGSNILVMDPSGSVIDSISYPGVKIDPGYNYYSKNKIITMDAKAKAIIVQVRAADGWHKMFSFPVESYFEKGAFLQIHISQDFNLLVIMGEPATILVLDLQTGKLLASATLPQSKTDWPMFNMTNDCLYIPSGSTLFTLFYRKKESGISTSKDLIRLLNSGYYKNAWPISDDAKKRLGLK